MQVKHNFKDLSDDKLIEDIVSKNDTLLLRYYTIDMLN